jgi:endoglucanase
MVTNLCPNNGNAQWCPAVGGANQYGYSYHFDIMAQSEVFGDNPVVEFEPVPCPGQAVSDWETCVCNGQTASDETPAGIAAAANPSPNPPASSAGASTAGANTPTPPAVSTSAAQSAVPDPAPVSKALSTLSTVKVSSTSTANPAKPPQGEGQQQHQQNACAVPH